MTTQIKGNDTSTFGGAITANNVGAGNVLQVKQTVSSSTISTTTADTNIASGLQVSITPSSTSSKILVMLNGGNAFNDTASKNMLLYFYRDGSPAETGPHAIMQNNANTASYKSSWSACYLDSPATTSSITYEPYFRINSGTGTGYFNQATLRVMLTVMEIAG